jgi:hypothetical protein
MRPFTDPLSGSESTREPETNAAGSALVNVRRVYIECHGDEWVDQELRGFFTAEIEGSRRFQMSDPERADAALKLYETPAGRPMSRGPGQDHRAAKAEVRVQLVNRAGEILWGTTMRVDKETSSQAARKAASEVFNDLLHHIRDLEKLGK